MTDVCLDGPVSSAVVRCGKSGGTFKTAASKGNLMAHASKEYAGSSAPDADGPLRTKYRENIQSSASKKGGASSIKSPSIPKPPVASKREVSNTAVASASCGTSASSDQLRRPPNNSVAATNCKASVPTPGELIGSSVLDLCVIGNPEHLERLLLVTGLMDEQLQALIAGSFGVSASKLRRLADKDPVLIPVVGHRG